MRYVVLPGVVLGLLCGGWTLVMGFTGWYKDPGMVSMFWVVLAIQIAVLTWGLKGTASIGRSYGGQVAAGTLMSMIGGLIVMGFSYLFTTVLFPTYFADLAAINQQALRSAGHTEAEIQAAMQSFRATATPTMNMVSGFLGTLVIGELATLVIAIFVRWRRTPADSTPRRPRAA